MKTKTTTGKVMRTFQRKALIVAQAQYEQKGDLLVLRRWRLIADGEPVGSWKPASKAGENSGWELTMDPKDLIERVSE